MDGSNGQTRSTGPTGDARPAKGVHLDLLVTDLADGYRFAVELKYLTDLWHGEWAGEQYQLLRHGAQDIRGYDCVKDIARVEQTIANNYAHAGLVLVISNDPAYWKAPGHGRSTNADAFRLYNGLTLRGFRSWGPGTGKGTMAGGRSTPIELRGAYPLAWRDYSHLPGSRGGFRFLAIPVAPLHPRV